MISFLGEGLESENEDIILSNLKTFIKIVAYCTVHRATTGHILRYIKEYDIDTGLSNLVTCSHV